MAGIEILLQTEYLPPISSSIKKIFFSLKRVLAFFSFAVKTIISDLADSSYEFSLSQFLACFKLSKVS